MAVDADLVWQMAREVLGRGPIDPDLLAETAERLAGLHDLVELGALIACNIGFSGHVFHAWGL